jgi:HK97 family phage major capsid protein
MASLAQINEDMRVLSHDLSEVFKEAGGELDMSKVTRLTGTNEQKAAWIREQHEKINALGVERDRLENLQKIAQLNNHEQRRLTEPVGERPPFAGANGKSNGSDGEGARMLRTKGLAQVIREHKGYQDLLKGHTRNITIELPVTEFKTLITLSDVNSQAMRQPAVNMALEERTVADLMAQSTTDRNSIEYYEETTVTNSATTVAEGGTKPESTLDWTLRTEAVRKIATWIPATRESLDDVSFLEGQIRNRLAFFVRRIEEQQLLGGDGTPPNLRGILNRSGIQTQAKGADPTPDTVYKAMQLIRGAAGAGFAEPTGVVFHPNDWTAIKLLRTADGIYIWGSPSEDGPDRIWGLPVRQTTAMTENTGLVGAFRPHAEVIRREGVTVTLSTEHSTYFVENKVAILAESRLALAVYRPSAFATCTGI